MSNLVLPLPSMLTAFVTGREPYTRVNIDEALNGKEYRSSWWAAPRTKLKLRFDSLLTGSATRQDFQQFATFFSRHFAQLDSFLFTDPDDNAVTAHGFGVGDGVTTAFQLQRTPGGTVYDLLGGPWPTSSQPRTNLCTFSEQIDNAAWTKSSTTVTANAAVAPDGNLTADQLVEVAASGQHVAVSAAFTALAATTYSHSIFVKANGRTQVVVGDFLSSAAAAFDLTLGAVTSASGGTGAIVSCGNGWYRCTLTCVPGAGSTKLQLFLANAAGVPAPSYLGDITKSVHLWGAQSEAASAATQYIATTAAAVQSSPAYWPGLGGFDPVYEVAPGPAIAVAGVAKVQGTDYSVAFNGGTLPALSGAITFTAAPASGAALTWTGSFYKRVRFLNPSWSVSRIVNSMYEGGLELVTVIP